VTQPPVDRDSARATRATTWFPVAQLAATAHQNGAAVLHALDGDGTPFCGLVPADALQPITDTGWNDVAASRRCRDCRIVMIGIGADDF
jgi:hypothetical protein